MTLRDDAYSRKLVGELSNALTARTHEAAVASRALRDAVCEYVSAEQTRGISLEAILASLKLLLAKAEHLAGHSSETMASQLMDWCLEFHAQPAYTPPDPDTITPA